MDGPKNKKNTYKSLVGRIFANRGLRVESEHNAPGERRPTGTELGIATKPALRAIRSTGRGNGLIPIASSDPMAPLPAFRVPLYSRILGGQGEAPLHLRLASIHDNTGNGNAVGTVAIVCLSTLDDDVLNRRFRLDFLLAKHRA